MSAAQAEDMVQLPQRWTVRDAVRFALHHSPDARIMQHRIAAANAMLMTAQSAFYPRLSLNGGYSRTNTPMYSFGNILNQGQFSPHIDFNNPGTSDDLKLEGVIQYRLYNGGRDQAGVKEAKAQTEATRFASTTLTNQLGFEVIKSFYSIIQAEDNVKARSSSVKALEAAVSSAQARYEAGDLLKADLLNLEVQKTIAAENLIKARHGLKLTRQGFLTLLGLQQGEVHLDTTELSCQTTPAAIDYANRPELAMLDAQIRAALEQLNQARAGKNPTADLFGSYQLEQGFEFDEGSGDSWIAGVKVNYTLFDGKQTAAQISLATANLAKLKEQRRKMELTFNYELNQARLALQLAREQVKVTQKMVEQAMESARLSRERFTEGALLSTDLIAVENRLTEARVRDLMATAGQRIAAADLRRTAGMPQFDNINAPCANTSQ